MNFTTLKTAVAKQFQSMTATGLFRVDVEPDLLWETYLESFPEGTNPIYKTRRSFDCSCCRHFVKHIIGVRMAENEAAKAAADRRETKNRIMGLIAQKQDEQLQSKSLEELQAMIAAL